MQKQPRRQCLQYQYCENSLEELKGLDKFQENFLNCNCFFDQMCSIELKVLTSKHPFLR